MGHLYGVALMDAVVEIREAAFRMRADGATQGGAGGQPPPNCLVLVAPDADAICASIIIERVLTGEKVLHDIAPVAGYTEVVRKCRAFGPNLRSVVLVNCGASANLGDLLWPARPADPDYLADWWSLPEEAHVYVLDVHRPFNHHNVRNREQRVTVLDYFALPGEGDDVPRAGDSDAEDELDEEEEEGGNRRRRRPSQARRRRRRPRRAPRRAPTAAPRLTSVRATRAAGARAARPPAGNQHRSAGDCGERAATLPRATTPRAAARGRAGATRRRVLQALPPPALVRPRGGRLPVALIAGGAGARGWAEQRGQHRRPSSSASTRSCATGAAPRPSAIAGTTAATTTARARR